MQINIEYMTDKGSPAKKIQEEKTDHEKAWKERLSSLSKEEQAHIAKKYYGGHYPWKG